MQRPSALGPFLSTKACMCCGHQRQAWKICRPLPNANRKSLAFCTNKLQKQISLVSLRSNSLCKIKDTKRSRGELKTASPTPGPSLESPHQVNRTFKPETHSKFTKNSPSQRIFENYGTLSSVFGTRDVITLSNQNALHCHFNVQRACNLLGSQLLASIHSGRVDVEDQPPSWLFVSPAVGGAYGAQVNVELDLEERLSGEALQALRENVKCRCLDMDIDRLLQNFKGLKEMQQEKAALVSQKDKILQQFKRLKEMSRAEGSEETKKHLGEELRAIKAEIAALKSSWDLEEKVMLEALSLPNHLHSTTPLSESIVLREAKSKEEPAQTLDHVEIARKFDLIKFSNVGPKAYYLRKDLVLAEMSLTSLVCDFLRSKGYRHMSGPEFVKTPVVEGCGGDIRDGYEVLTMLDPHKTMIEPMNHLSGVSLHMFAAYVAKTCIGDSLLPLQMFGCGRRYQNNDLPGLFGAIQSTQAALFSCVKEDDVDRQFENSLELIWQFLQGFGFTLRLRQVCAQDLRREETRRVDFEMFSPSLQQLLPVASVSDVGDFLSRRLMVSHNQNHADIRTARRLHMIHGTVLNITSFLALWMEHSVTHESKFTLCDLPSLQNGASMFPSS